MKKLFIASFAVAAFALTLSSCKKDYTCTCTYGSSTTSVTLHASKKDAKAACESSATTYGSGYSCKID